MPTYKQEPPFCIHMELAEGCNLACSMCGINGIREKPGNFKFMTLENATLIASRIAQAKWNSRIEFAMHGEPTMNPEYVEIIRTFRTILPRNQLMMTTNGLGLTLYPKKGHAGHNITDLFNAGLNILGLEDYEQVKICEKVVSQMAADGWEISMTTKGKNPIPIYFYPSEQEGNPHRRIKPNDKFMSIIMDIREATKGTHVRSRIENHTGAGGPLNDSMKGKRCAKPFREFPVLWNGWVTGCCVDWRGYFKVGNLLDTPAEELWQAKVFQVMRKLLYRGERVIGPCHGCDHKSFRPGLLPDKFGKQTLPKASAEDRALLTRIVSEPPLITPVVRPWEIQKP